MSCKPARVLLHRFFFLQVSKPGILHINNSRHLARKYARIFVHGNYLFRDANSFLRAKLEENCELQIMSKDKYPSMFSPQMETKYCLYNPSNLFRNAHNFQSWGIFSDIPQFQLGNIRSCDALGPIAHERKDLMDYKKHYQFYFILHMKKYMYNVQFQKISILPPQRGLEFPGGWGVLQGQKI